ncbi:ABC transporter permease [Risungbinella massiliensis]|uniref:ABC transporter permease n=1 Tax=Risungbinella massiliensis TaxID=1329796 RepID=UPI0005CC27FD|nr:ABC transporter permease [Risungbinella massiliensis]
MKWRLGWRSILAHPKRSWMLFLGVTFSFLLLGFSQVFLVAMESSVEQTLSQQFGDFDLRISKEKEGRFSIEEQQKIQQLSGVKSLFSLYRPYSAQDRERYQLLVTQSYYGIEPITLQIEKLSITEGSFPKGTQVLFSERYMKQTGWKVGDQITMPFPPFGEKKVVISGMFSNREGTERFAFFEKAWLQSTFQQSGQATSLFVRVSDIQEKEKVTQLIRQMVPDLKIDTRKQMEEARESFSGLKPVVYGTEVAILLASWIFLISTLRLQLQERQHELASYRLMGASHATLRGLILIEIGILLVLAMGVALVVSWLSTRWMPWVLSTTMQLPASSFVFPWQMILLLFMGFSLLLILSGLLLGNQVAKISPIQSIQEPIRMEKMGTWRWWQVLLISLTIIVSVVAMLGNQQEVYLAAAILLLISSYLLLSVWFPILLKASTWFWSIWKKKAEGTFLYHNTIRHHKKTLPILSLILLSCQIGVIGIGIFTTIGKESEQKLLSEHPYRYLLSATNQFQGYPKQISESLADRVDTISLGVDEFVLLVDKTDRDLREEYGTLMLYQGKQHIATTVKGMEIKEFQRVTKLTDEMGKGVVMTKEFAELLGYRLGDTMRFIREGESKERAPKIFSLPITAILETNPFGKGRELEIFLPQQWVEEVWGKKNYSETFFLSSKPEQEEQLAKTLQQLATQSTDFTLFDRNAAIQELEQQLNQRFFFLGLTIFLLWFIALVGLFSLIQSSFLQRSQEFAMLQAVAITPRQSKRLITGEGILLLWIGTILGITSAGLVHFFLLRALEATIVELPWILMILLLEVSPILGFLLTRSIRKQIDQVPLLQRLQKE